MAGITGVTGPDLNRTNLYWMYCRSVMADGTSPAPGCGGLNWPGGIPFLGPFLGGTTYDIDANVVIWNFVSQFHLP
jgi:hypothetical protein